MNADKLAPLRTEHRVFEPQLSSGLAWVIAAILAVVASVAGPQPPELMALACFAAGVLLLLRMAAGQIAGNAFRYLVSDPWRTLAYVVAVALLLAAGIRSALAAGSLPGCAPVESIAGLPSLGPFHLADLAATGVVAALTVAEPLLFRRSLAVQFLWPSSALSYWSRWAARIVAPSLILVIGLGLHRAAAGRLWGPHLDARELAGEVLALGDKRGLSRAAGGPLDDEATVHELVTIAMCQADDALADTLVNTMQAQRRYVKAEIWRDLEDYVYRKVTAEDGRDDHEQHQ